MGTIANLNVKLSLEAANFTKGLQDTQAKLASWGKSMTDLGKKMTVGVTTPIVAGMGFAINAASDLSEAQSAVNTVYGDGANMVLDWSKQAAKANGLSQEQYLSSATVLGVYGDMLDLTGKQNAEFSNSLIQGSADLASFYNANTTDVLGAMQAALRGEFDPLEQYGILLNQSTLQQYAMEQGIWDGSGAMTNQQKVMATHQYILDHLGAAQGDFARTSDGLANSQRILRAQLTDTAAQFGQFLLPYVQQAVQFFSKLLTAVQNLSPGIQKLIVGVAALAAALGPALIILGTMLPALGLLLSPIGLLIVAFAALAAVLTAAYLKNWGGFQTAIDGVAKSMAKFIKTFTKMYALISKTGKYGKVVTAFRALGFAIADITGLNPKLIVDFFTGLGKAIDRPLQALKKMAEALGGIGKAILSGDFKGALQQGKKFLAGFGDYLASPAKAIGQFLKGIQTGFKPLDNVLHTAGKLFTDFGRLVQELFQGDLSGAFDVAQRMFSHFGELAGQAWDLLKAGFDAIDWGALASGALSALEGVGSDLLQGVINGWNTHKDTLKGYASGLAGWVLEQITDAPDKLKSVGEALLNGVIAGWDFIKPTLASYASGLGSWVLSQITDAASALLQVGRDLIQGILSGWDEAGLKLDAYASGLTTWVFAQITDVGTALLGVGTGLIQGVLDGWDSLKGTLQSYASGLPGWVAQQITDAKTALESTGTALITGLVNGITNAAGGVKDAILGTVGAAISALIEQANKIPGVNINNPFGGGGSGGSGLDIATREQQLVEGDYKPPAIPLTPGQSSMPDVTPINEQKRLFGGNRMKFPELDTTAFVKSVNQLPGLLAKGIASANKLASTGATVIGATIGTAFGTMVGNVNALMGQFTNNVGQGMSDALSAASTYATAIYTVVSTQIGTMVGNVAALMGQNTNNVGQGMSNALSAASTYSNAIYTVVSTNIGRMVGNVAALVGSVPGIVTGAMNDAAASGGAAAYNAGLAIGGGLANGINAMIPAVRQAAADLANAAIVSTNTTVKTSSPSKVFHQIGVYVGEGFVNGIESRYAAATRAGNGLAASAIPGIGGSDSGASMGRGAGFANYGTIRVETPSPEDFYIQWRQQQIGGVRR